MAFFRAGLQYRLMSAAAVFGCVWAQFSVLFAEDAGSIPAAAVQSSPYSKPYTLSFDSFKDLSDPLAVWEEKDIPAKTVDALRAVPGMPAQPALGAIPAVPEAWTRATAVAYALATNPDVIVGRAQLEQSTGVKMQVRAGLFPQITASGGVSAKQESTIDVMAPLRFLPDTYNLSNYSITLSFQQLVFDGFQTFNAFRSKRFAEQSSYWSWVNTVYQITTQTQQAFDNILVQQAVIAAYNQSLETYKKLSEIACKRYEAGDITRLDGMRVESEFEAAKAGLASAYSELAASQESFCKLLQLPSESRQETLLKLEGPLTMRSYALSEEESLVLASDMHPAVISARLDTASASAALRSSQGAYLPKVTAFANYGNQQSQYTQGRNPQGWTVGLNAQFTIFDAFGREGAVVIQRANLRSAGERLAQTRYTLASQVRQLFAQKNAYAAAVFAQEMSVNVGRQALQESERLYQLGAVGIEDVLDAERRLRASEIELPRALYKHNQAVYNLEYTVGMEPPALMPTLQI